MIDLPKYQIGQRTFIYAGIGSRQTPSEVLEIMTGLGIYLEQRGYTLHTGDADGADKAFGLKIRNKIIFTANDAINDAKAHQIVDELHPNPKALNQYSKNLMARNAYQVLGKQLKNPVDFVICWTPNGEETHAERTIKTGGTGQAISLASICEIPVINIANGNWKEKLKNLL